MHLDQIISPQLVVGTHSNSDEFLDAAMRFETTALALNQFIAGRINFSDYVDILETCGVDIDQFLIAATDNLALVY